MPLSNEPLILGTRVFFFREGAAFTVPSSGTAGAGAKPGATDPAWVELGAVDASSESVSQEEKKVYAPDPGHLVLRKRVITKLERQIKFTLVDYGPAAIEFATRSGPLTSASTTFTPFADPTKTGWLKVQRADEEDNIITTEILWVTLEADGDVTFGDDFAKVSLVATMHQNALNAGTILS